MYYRIYFRPSDVPYTERDTYRDKLNALCSQSKYQQACAYRDEYPLDYELIVRSAYPCDVDRDTSKAIKAIFRELVKKRCVIYDYENGKYLYGRKLVWF